MQTGEPKSLQCLGGPWHAKSIKYQQGAMGRVIGENAGTHGYGFTLLIDK